MNQYQELWWTQAQSDHKALLVLRRTSADPCQQLHYLQMVTEKIAKAYFWRSGTPPPRRHPGFVQFMRSLGGVQRSQQTRLASTLDFKSFNALQIWIRAVLPLVYELERIAPALAQNGPNPEYPWPHDAPVQCPARHEFALWGQLTSTGLGHQLLKVVQSAVDCFPSYG